MASPTTLSSTTQSVRLGDRAFDALAVNAAFLSYFIIFAIVRRDQSLVDAALSSLINLLPLLLLAAAVRAYLRRFVVGAALPKQIAVHFALAAVFAMVWHWLLMVLMGVRTGGSFTEFVVRAFFPNPAVAWQLLQGVTVYALVAALTYLRIKADLPSFVTSDSAAETKTPGPMRYFIRRGDEIFPVDVSQIVSITGADDYAEVSTLNARHLVRTTLADFEGALGASSFLRVHRSRIVNLDHMSRAEPAGDGRMLLHMNNGEVIHTSRAGAKLLRDRVI